MVVLFVLCLAVRWEQKPFFLGTTHKGCLGLTYGCVNKKVHVGKDQENAQSEKDSHSKNLGGKKPN